MGLAESPPHPDRICDAIRPLPASGARWIELARALAFRYPRRKQELFPKANAMSGSHDHTHAHHHHDHADLERWKHDGVRVIPGNQLDPNVPSTPGMDRKAAIN